MSGSSESPAWSVILSQTQGAGLAIVHEAPDSEEKLIAILQAAQQNKMPVLRGRPGRVPPASKVNSLLYLDLSSMSGVIEHERADQVIKVGSGISVAELNEYLAKHQQWWPVYAPKDMTLCDAIESASGGSLEHRFGGPRHLVLGARVVLGDGQAINCGGRVVKNVTGYDMTKLFIGSHGWLGMVTSAFLRLYALPESSKTILWNFEKVESLLAAAEALQRSGLPLSCLEMGNGDSLKTALDGEFEAVTPGIDARSFVLLAQVHGIPAVTSEIQATSERLVSDTVSGDSQYRELSGEPEAVLWKAITNTFGCASDVCAEVAIPLSSLRLVVDELSNFDAWIFRPATGRLMLKFETPKNTTGDITSNHSGAKGAETRDEDHDGTREACRLPADLARFGNKAQQPGLPLTMALADNEHNYHVFRFPKDDRAIVTLQENLKDRFDSGRILNPFVSL